MARLPGRLGLVVVCFRISSVLYILVGLLAMIGPMFIIPLLPPEEAPAAGFFIIFGLFFGLITIGIAIGVEVVIWYLKKLRYWAWVTAIVISALYLTGIFLPLGILGLMGLLDSETQAAFQAARLHRKSSMK
ncbi:MAG: hypothetical protein WBA57_15440 [Elainellaceae cyanobacterium]